MMNENSGTFGLLQNWYHSSCNGDWEHQYGIAINTLDNPGWSIKIDLAETTLEDKAFVRVEVKRGENDWVHCWVSERIFNGRGGPLNLTELIETFLAWAA